MLCPPVLRRAAPGAAPDSGSPGTQTAPAYGQTGERCTTGGSPSAAASTAPGAGPPPASPPAPAGKDPGCRLWRRHGAGSGKSRSGTGPHEDNKVIV